MVKQEEKNPSRKTDLENLGTINTEDDDLNTFGADIPLEYTASWGTGVHEFSADSQGGRVFGQSDRRHNEEEAAISGGDIESNQEDAEAVGDEGVGGSAPTPDQDIVDELGVAVGLEMAD